MQTNDSDTDPVQAEYEAAVGQGHASWEKLHDATVHPVERVKAYVAWRAVATRAKDLARKLDGRTGTGPEPH